MSAARLELAGLSELVPPYAMQRWRSPHHIVLFTLAGRARLLVEGARHDLVAGTVCVLPASVDTHYWACGRWEIVWFHPQVCAEWDGLMGRDAVLRPSVHGARIARLADWIGSELAGTEAESGEAARLGFDLMLHTLKRELRGEGDPRDRDWRRRLDRLWEEAMRTPAEWSVDALAAAAGCSRTHLHVLCRRFYAQSPRERLVRIRMQRAADYLRHTPWPLEQIGALAGYADAFAFSKAFRRETGSTPAQYRRRAASDKMT